MKRILAIVGITALISTEALAGAAAVVSIVTASRPSARSSSSSRSYARTPDMTPNQRAGSMQTVTLPPGRPFNLPTTKTWSADNSGSCYGDDVFCGRPK